jgi:predicted SAM-dependent methyltransferase
MTIDTDVLITSYLAMCESAQERLRATKPTDSRARKILKYAVPVRLRGTARMVLTDAVAIGERRKAARLAASTSPLHLHLGCGGIRKEGWLNVDLVGDPVDLAWDLAKPLPFADGSVDAVFHEHLLEHLPLAAGLSFTQECFRVLRPGGIIRVGVPDAGRLLRSYVDPNDDYLDRLHPGRPTRLLAAQELFYWHRHCTMFDTDTLTLLLVECGFEGVAERSFGVSDLPVAPDSEQRRANSLYVEAHRPE